MELWFLLMTIPTSGESSVSFDGRLSAYSSMKERKKERKNLFFRLINIVISKTKVISSMHLSSEWTTNETIGPHKSCPYIAHILNLTSNKRKKFFFFFFFFF